MEELLFRDKAKRGKPQMGLCTGEVRFPVSGAHSLLLRGS